MTHKYDDPVGPEWQLLANAAWVEAVRKAGPIGNPLDYYVPVPLPDFNANTTDVVTRQARGRFFQSAGLVHDLYAATADCRISGDGTYYHFAHELPDEFEACGHCKEGTHV